MGRVQLLNAIWSAYQLLYSSCNLGLSVCNSSYQCSASRLQTSIIPACRSNTISRRSPHGRYGRGGSQVLFLPEMADNMVSRSFERATARKSSGCAISFLTWRWTYICNISFFHVEMSCPFSVLPIVKFSRKSSIE
jgi:hypothetical protein